MAVRLLAVLVRYVLMRSSFCTPWPIKEAEVGLQNVQLYNVAEKAVLKNGSAKKVAKCDGSVFYHPRQLLYSLVVKEAEAKAEDSDMKHTLSLDDIT